MVPDQQFAKRLLRMQWNVSLTMNTSNKTEWLMLWLFLALIGLGVFFIQPSQLQIKPLTESDILALVSTLFVVAIFVERANESVLVPLRTPDRQLIELEIERVKALPDAADRANEIRELEAALLRYRLGTAKWAYWISLLLGFLISMVGVRIVESLVLVPPGFSGFQQQLLTYVDIVLTGCVISGGSAAIDKIGRRIGDAYNLKSVTNQSAANKG